jgi:GNAT superfamily N-acetyltransferase
VTAAAHTLTRDALEAQLQAFVDIGADASPWREAHLRVELPEKWRLSIYVGDDRPVGYAVMSLRGPGWIHLHQFMVAKAHRGRGLGSLMLAEAKSRCAREGARLSLKVAIGNPQVTRFYVREGMREGHVEGGYLWMYWPDLPEARP